MPQWPILQARWQTASARNNSAWIILRPLRQPIPCANNSASYVRPYTPPYMQRITWKHHTYKRATLLLLALALRIDSRRATPTLYTVSSVPYRPRIPTPRKENQHATYTPQISAPLQARRCTSFPARYPAHIPPTPQPLHGSPWEDRNHAHTIRRRLQPTPAAALDNSADGPETQGQPQPLQTIPPAWTVSAAAIRANWATFSRFSAGYLRTIRPSARRNSRALACIFIHKLMHFCIFATKIIYHIRQMPAKP